MSEIDIGAAEWYLDPREVDKKVEDMTNLVNETVEQYPHLPGLGNKLNEKLYESTTALRLTAQEETQKLVEARVSGKLQEVSMQYGLQGRFQDVYMGMVDVIAPFATALGGPAATRDLLHANFGQYFANHYNASSQFPSQAKIDLLNQAITNKDMQSIISPETMGGAIKVHKQMIEALKTTNASNLAERKDTIVAIQQYRDKHKLGPLPHDTVQQYLLTGDKHKIDPEKMTDLELRKEKVKAAKALGFEIPKEVEGPYLMTGNIPDNVNKEIDARKVKIKEINDNRAKLTSTTGTVIPPLPRHIEEHYILTGEMYKDSSMETALKNIAHLRSLGINVSKEQEAHIIAKEYQPTPEREGERTVETATKILQREPTSTERIKLAGVDEGRPLVELHDKRESKFGEVAFSEIAKQLTGAREEKTRSFENLNRLERMEVAINKGDFTPGAFAKTRLQISRIAEWVNSIAPNELMDRVINLFGQPSTAEEFDQPSKEMLLLMAKYVGRITNLSLTFSRDTVPGLFKTREGNLVIIAFLRRDAEIKIALGKIAEEYILKGSLQPEGEMSYFDAVNTYRKDNPYFNDKLNAAIDAAKKSLPPKDAKKIPKNTTKILAKPPKPNDKAFKAYLKNHNLSFPAGTTYKSTTNGKHLYVHPDGTGTEIPVHWDDKKPIVPLPTAPAPPSDVTLSPAGTKKPVVLDIKNVEHWTLGQIANATAEDVEAAWKEYEDIIKKEVDPDVVDAIVDIVNELRKP